MTFEDVKRIRENPTAEDVDNRELHRLIDIAIEKQIPKKPKVIFDEYSYFECGNCGEAIYCSDELKTHRYCLNCGQVLDWGDGE